MANYILFLHKQLPGGVEKVVDEVRSLVPGATVEIWDALQTKQLILSCSCASVEEVEKLIAPCRAVQCVIDGDKFVIKSVPWTVTPVPSSWGKGCS